MTSSMILLNAVLSAFWFARTYIFDSEVSAIRVIRVNGGLFSPDER